jgi:hypothetical protein
VTLESLAALFEARGLTSPDRHDFVLVRLGQRVRISEIAEICWRAEARVGETTLSHAKRLFRTLPTDHQVGLVHLVVGTDDSGGEFASFLGQQARRHNFGFSMMIAPRPTRDVFDGFFSAVGLNLEVQGHA